MAICLQQMNNLASFLRSRKETDVVLLICICLIVTSRWFNQELPTGHDTIGGIGTAALVKSLLQVGDTLLPWSRFVTLESFYLGPPFFHYFLAGFASLLSWAVAAKLLFTLFFLLASVSAYYFTFEITGSRPSGFVAALAYTFSPFYLIEVVFEGHWGIGAAYALTPFLFLATEKTIQHPHAGRILLAGATLALLIALTHPQTFPLLVGPFWVLYVVFRIWQSGRTKLRETAAAVFVVAFIGLLLTAFWWLPLLHDAQYFHATYSSIDEAAWYSASLGQALTLRPILCCAGSSAYGASGDIATRILQTIPFVLALLGVVANLRNRYVWIFSALAVPSLVLAMGPSSPDSLFWFAHSHLPFFKWIRTPSRFLIFAGFAYAVLTGFCTKAMLDWLKHIHLRRFRSLASPAVLVSLVGLAIVGNTWHGAREAFTTFTLPPDHKNSLSFLADQQDGDYRIADASFETEACYPESGTVVVNPTYWVFVHGKETAPGGMPQTSIYAAGTMNYLRDALGKTKVDMSEWLSILNVKYAVVDKGNPLNSNVILNDNFERVFTSDSVDVYENHQMIPRVFTVTSAHERPVNLWSGDSITASLPDSNVNATLSLDTENVRTFDRALKATCVFAESGLDATSVAIDIEYIDLSAEDAIHLVFYSDDDLPDISMSLDLLERDGSRYGMEIFRTDGIKAGWNEINFPLSLLTLRDSTDDNDHLDVDQIQTLAFGPMECGNYEANHRFSLYFDTVSVIAHRTAESNRIEYTKLRAGKYEVHVNLDSPSYLVLSESYHPYWVAHVDGKDIRSQVIYECLNSFYLEPGEYEVTVEFTTSPLRIAANVISGVMALLVCCTAFLLLGKWLQNRMARKDH